MNELYLECIDTMIDEAMKKNNLPLLSILYTLKGSIIADDTRNMCVYTIYYSNAVIDRINKSKK